MMTQADVDELRALASGMGFCRSHTAILRALSERELLRAVLSGVEVALARDADIDGAMKLIVAARHDQQTGADSK